MWQRISSLIIKELLAVWRDKRSRLVLIIPPLIQLLIFSQATLDVKNVSIGILNRDSGRPSHELVQRFLGSPYFTTFRFLKNEGEIQSVINNEKSVVVLHIDDQFTRNLLSHNQAIVQLILDGRKSNTSQIVSGYASRIVEQYNSDMAEELNIPTPPTFIVPRYWYNPNLIYNWFTVPGFVAILSMVTSLTVTALSITREKELGTFEQLLISPLRPIDILIGKTIPGVLIGLGEGTIMLLIAISFFNIPLTGSVWALYLSLFIFILSNVGIGLFFSSLCTTQQQALLVGFCFMAPAVTLSGIATPIENMPDWLQMLTYLNPLRHFLVIVRGVFLKAMPPSIVIAHTYPIMVIAMINLIASTWFFRKRLE